MFVSVDRDWLVTSVGFNLSVYVTLALWIRQSVDCIGSILSGSCSTSSTSSYSTQSRTMVLGIF